MLVEVKGDFNLKIIDLEQYVDKIIKSGWKGCFLIVGTQIYDSYNLKNDPSKGCSYITQHRAILGLFYYYFNGVKETSLIKTYLYLQPTKNDYIPIYICEPNSDWVCTPYSYENGCECICKPVGYAEFCDTTNSYDIIDKIYQECKNMTQWKPKVRKFYSKSEKNAKIMEKVSSSKKK